ncbi:MAG: DNA/RNA non-specific endonuclease [Gemmatimonadota bacterium]|nr:DNA/RNA non-specific endonuclease [Gemmatimonadota bacterium]
MSSRTTLERIFGTRLFLTSCTALVLFAACSPDKVVAPTPQPAAAPEQPSLYTYPSAIYRSHVEFGVPSDGSMTNDTHLSKRTHYLSHNCSEGGPNWVSWNLNKTHFGDAPRATSFYADTELPAGCYRVVSSDYTYSGYSRGHMVRSEERTWSIDDNKKTFLMTNILPQTQDMNGGPWYKFELYLQDLAQASNKELYVIAGPIGNKGTLNGAGKVVIPTYTWKIVVVMPYGQGLANVTSSSSIQVIAVKMPNTTGISANSWTTYKTTVNDIENLTKYDFLAKLPDSIETYWEGRVY